ncbi:MAG: hypothetical protein FLDDKLPJ_02828 [Phycisphaerae bacterium]|nr:hypothetical protein [Phycisphaerae bacterium]
MYTPRQENPVERVAGVAHPLAPRGSARLFRARTCLATGGATHCIPRAAALARGAYRRSACLAIAMAVGLAGTAPAFAQNCDAVINKAVAKDRDGDGDCEVTVKGVDPTPGDEFEVALGERLQFRTANSRGKWKAKFNHVDGGALTVSACGMQRQTFCPGFPPIRCADIVNFEAWCDGSGTLSVVVNLADLAHDGDRVAVGVTTAGGETGPAFYLPVRDGQARLVSHGWSNDLDVALLTPLHCFLARRLVACGAPAGRWCELRLTTDMEVRLGECDEAACRMKKGAVICTDGGPTCFGPEQCPPDSEVVLWKACWSDGNEGRLLGECTADARYTGCHCPR